MLLQLMDERGIVFAYHPAQLSVHVCAQSTDEDQQCSCVLTLGDGGALCTKAFGDFTIFLYFLIKITC